MVLKIGVSVVFVTFPYLFIYVLQMVAVDALRSHHRTNDESVLSLSRVIIPSGCVLASKCAHFSFCHCHIGAHYYYTSLLHVKILMSEFDRNDSAGRDICQMRIH